MYLRTPKQLHLELTSWCNASCPMCSREIFPIDQPTTLTYRDIVHACDGIKFELISYCGNDGDPLMAKDLTKIVNHFQHTPQMIHTNGSLRKREFWATIGRIPNLTVVFAIDGVDQPTHSKYRKGTDYNRIIANAQAYINAGGTARWQFIAFDHNAHQIQQAQQTASECGFDKFELVYSHRPAAGDIQPIQFIRRQPASAKVECLAAIHQKVYVRSDGEVFPCVYRGARGEYSGLNIKDKHLSEIVFDPYFDSIDFTHPVCQSTCKYNDRNQRDRTSV